MARLFRFFHRAKRYLNLCRPLHGQFIGDVLTMQISAAVCGEQQTHLQPPQTNTTDRTRNIG